MAAVRTLEVTAAGILIGLAFGLIAGFGKISKNPLFRWPASFYVYIIRGTPLLLQLWYIYLGLAEFISLDAFTSAALGLGIHNGAYIAEIFRGAIQSIDRGQMEAAESLGMTYLQAMRRVILPQALKRAVPPLGNQLIIALKDSSLASTITIHELLLQSKILGASHFAYIEMLTVAGLFYLAFTTVLTLLVNSVESRLGVSDYRD